jgi:hypothetical protein
MTEFLAVVVTALHLLFLLAELALPRHKESPAERPQRRFEFARLVIIVVGIPVSLLHLLLTLLG